MGSESNKSKKWPGLKLPMGKLFSPRAVPKPSTTNKRDRSAEEQSPLRGTSSGATAATESLTENEESPRKTPPGKSKLFGRIRQPKGGDDNELRNLNSSHGTSSTHPRRTSGALDLLRNAMFSHSKENTVTTIDGSTDAREISASFHIDPYFDRQDYSNSRPSTILRPPSISDLTSSERSSQSSKPRSPRPMGKGARPASPATGDIDAKPHNPTLSQKLRIGENKLKNPSPDDGPRSPRPMKTGVRNPLVNFMTMPSTIDEDSEASSFHPTLSQKIRIGQEEIKKRIETRLAPQLDPHFTPPSSVGIDTEDSISFISGVSEVIHANASKNGTSSTHNSMATVKMSNLLGPAADNLELSNIPPPAGTPQYSPRRKTSKGHDHKSPGPTPSNRLKASTSNEMHRRPRPSHEKSLVRSKHNSDSSKRSRGRSGPRRPKTPTKRSSTESPTSPHHVTQDPERKLSRSRKSPYSHSRHSSSRTRHHDIDKQQEEMKRAKSNEPQRSHSRQGKVAFPTAEDRKRSKSLDESLSRAKGVEQDRSKSGHDSHNYRTHRGDSRDKRSGSHDSSHHPEDDSMGRSKSSEHTVLERKRSKSMEESYNDSRHTEPRSPGSRHHRSTSSHHKGLADSEEEEKRRSKSSKHAAVERKHSGSMDESPTKSRHTDHISPGSRHHYSMSSHHEDSARERTRSHEPSHHREGTDRGHSSWIEESPLPLRRKRSKSLDESLSSRTSREKPSDRVENNASTSHHNRSPSRVLSRSKDEKVRSPRFEERKVRRESEGDPDLTSSKNDPVRLPQKVLSKAERAKREESCSSPTPHSPSRQPRSPRKSASSRDGERSAASRSPASTIRPVRRANVESETAKNELSDSSRRSTLRHRRSSSPRRESTSSSHRPGSPRTPSARSASPGVRTSPRERWEALLERNGSGKDKNGEVLKPPLAGGPTQDHTLVQSPGRNGPSLREEGDKIRSASPTTVLRRTGSKGLMPPLTPDRMSRPLVMSETQKAYRAVNKMADNTFRSPLGDPPGRRISHSARPTRTPSPLPHRDPSTVSTVEQQSTEDEARKSRTTTLKNNLRKMEQQYCLNASTRSQRSASANSRGHSTHRRSPSGHQRRRGKTEDSSSSPRRTPSNPRNGSKDRTVKQSVDHLVPPVSPAPQASKTTAGLDLVLESPHQNDRKNRKIEQTHTGSSLGENTTES